MTRGLEVLLATAGANSGGASDEENVSPPT